MPSGDHPCLVFLTAMMGHLSTMSAMGHKIKAVLSSAPMTTLLYYVVRGYSLTFRLVVENEQPWLNHLNEGGKVILCVWHQQFFPLIRYCERYRAYRPSIMISRSQDGELIARVAAKSGWFPVRGSSSRGASPALRALVEKVKETGLAAHIVDGPTGPAGKVKQGVMHLAQMTGAVLVPVGISANRAWYAKSWDRFLVPKPFSQVILHFGEVINYDDTMNQEELEKRRKHLESIMAPWLTK